MAKIHPGSVLGIIGGGQLGRMTALAAASLGMRVCIFSDQEDSPAAHVSDKVVVADYKDKAALDKFAEICDVVTYEFENIPYEAVEYLSKKVDIRPNPKAIYIAQNRYREKTFLNSLGVETTKFAVVDSYETLAKAYADMGGRAIMKTQNYGYDGKGQYVIDEQTNLKEFWQSNNPGSCILEKMVDFEKEISVVLARDFEGNAAPYMPSENIHKNGILDVSKAPADIDWELIDKSFEITSLIADSLDVIGLLTVEFFLTKDKKLLVNEIAPRPHNSGHWTMDACTTSQFEQLVRAVCEIPLGSNAYHSDAVMKNLIGDDIKLWEQYVSDPDTKVHIYGKTEIKPGRKMGHVTHLVSYDEDVIDG